MKERTPQTASATRFIEHGSDPVITVLLAVADALGTDPQRIHHTLNDVVDTDALTILLRNANEADEDDWQLSFEFDGCAVQVTGGGSVTATPL